MGHVQPPSYLCANYRSLIPLPKGRDWIPPSSRLPERHWLPPYSHRVPEWPGLWTVVKMWLPGGPRTRASGLAWKARRDSLCPAWLWGGRLEPANFKWICEHCGGSLWGQLMWTAQFFRDSESPIVLRHAQEQGGSHPKMPDIRSLRDLRQWGLKASFIQFRKIKKYDMFCTSSIREKFMLFTN